MSTTPTREQLVDEFGELSREAQAWAPKARRITALQTEIRSWYPDLAADQTAIAEGTSYDVQVGEKSIEKDWKSMAAVVKAVGGMKNVLKLATVTFKALSGVLGNSAAEALQVEARTGYRKLHAVARVTPAVAVDLPKAA